MEKNESVQSKIWIIRIWSTVIISRQCEAHPHYSIFKHPVALNEKAHLKHKITSTSAKHKMAALQKKNYEE
jgi:hypothetical protein